MITERMTFKRVGDRANPTGRVAPGKLSYRAQQILDAARAVHVALPIRSRRSSSAACSGWLLAGAKASPAPLTSMARRSHGWRGGSSALPR